MHNFQTKKAESDLKSVNGCRISGVAFSRAWTLKPTKENKVACRDREIVG